MTTKTLPSAAEAEVERWCNGEVLHFWEVDGTYMVVAKDGEDLYFLRIFQLGSEYALSEDGRAVAL